MSGKLDQSLDTILAARKKTSRPRRAPRRGTGAKPAAAAPVGGVKKTTRPANKGEKKAHVPTGPAKSESKIMVSNLPSDVTETQIKEYFQKTVDPVKRILLVYGPNGQSRGIATVIFSKPTAAAKAVKELNGVKVDGRPMKVEVIVEGKDVAAPPPAKTLMDRVTQPKNAAKPKPATGAKGEKSGGKKSGRKPNPRNKRPTKKTAEELDAEMTDYFQQGTVEGTVTNGGAVQSATDATMADDI